MTSTLFSVSIILIENEPYEINGINLWQLEWKNTGQKLPLIHNGTTTLLAVYEIYNSTSSARFIAFEVSNNVWRVDHPYY